MKSGFCCCCCYCYYYSYYLLLAGIVKVKTTWRGRLKAIRKLQLNMLPKQVCCDVLNLYQSRQYVHTVQIDTMSLMAAFRRMKTNKQNKKIPNLPICLDSEQSRGQDLPYLLYGWTMNDGHTAQPLHFCLQGTIFVINSTLKSYNQMEMSAIMNTDIGIWKIKHLSDIAWYEVQFTLTNLNILNKLHKRVNDGLYYLNYIFHFLWKEQS